MWLRLEMDTEMKERAVIIEKMLVFIATMLNNFHTFVL